MAARPLIGAFALCLVTSVAGAEGEAESSDDTAPYGPGGYAWAEAAVFVEQNRGPTVTSISPLVGADYWIKRLVEVRARFGWSGVRLSSDEVMGTREDRRWRWSNVLVGASYKREIADYYPFVFELSAGIDLALPTAHSASNPRLGDVDDAQVLRQAATMRGVRDVWLWSPDTLGIVVPLTAQLVHDYAHVKLALDVATMIPFDDSADFAVQLLGEAGGWVQRKLLLALALSLATSPTDVYEDVVVASGAFRSIVKLDAIRFHLDVWLNLNGFRTFTIAGSRWGVVIGIGAALPGT